MPKQAIMNQKDLVLSGGVYLASLTLSQWHEIAGIALALASLAYLARRWWVQEKTGWRKR